MFFILDIGSDNLKVLKLIALWILSLICIIILTIGSSALITAIQARLFLPQEYIMYIFKYPISDLVFIYWFYIIFGLNYNLTKGFRNSDASKKSFIKIHKKIFLPTFVILNIILIYTILFDVTVITNNKIIDYTFLSPSGKEYSTNDIVKIDTGVYGEKNYLPFSHYSKGDFYYIIQLNDGTRINLTDEGGVKIYDDYTQDTHFIIEKLDKQFVNHGIYKISSIDNFEYCTKNLDKIYTDKIRNILLNVR
jgi:hypothetical protein